MKRSAESQSAPWCQSVESGPGSGTGSLGLRASGRVWRACSAKRLCKVTHDSNLDMNEMGGCWGGHCVNRRPMASLLRETTGRRRPGTRRVGRFQGVRVGVLPFGITLVTSVEGRNRRMPRTTTRTSHELEKMEARLFALFWSCFPVDGLSALLVGVCFGELGFD